MDFFCTKCGFTTDGLNAGFENCRKRTPVEDHTLTPLQTPTDSYPARKVSRRGGLDGVVPSALVSLAAIDVSASTVARQERYLYEAFALPLGSNGYVPNELLRNLKASVSVDDAVPAFLAMAVASLYTMKSHSYPHGGSETAINDPNTRTLMEMLADLCHDASGVRMVRPNTNEKLQFRTFLAGRTTKPEHHLTYEDHYVVVASSEAKGVESSDMEALMQCFQVCADSALCMRSAGVPLAECVVPGILCLDSSIVVIGVYLIEATFPVCVTLSKPLSLVEDSGRRELTHWLLALSRFVQATVARLRTAVLAHRGAAVAVEAVTLDMQRGFFKPILSVSKLRQGGAAPLQDAGQYFLNYILSIYECLRQQQVVETTAASDFILFPTGAVCVPSSKSQRVTGDITRALLAKMEKFFLTSVPALTPVLVYDHLDETWSNQPPMEEGPHQHQYLACLSHAVVALNAAKVAHMDLRPDNIMWRSHDGQVQMRVIDFEEARKFGDILLFGDIYSTDARYPVPRVPADTTGVSYWKASAKCNDWFLYSVRDYVTSGGAFNGYTRFMEQNHGKYQEFYAEPC